jgi:cytochrome c biogenesis protein CcdA
MLLDNITLPIVLGTALVDSINPCAIGVLVLLLGVLLANAKNKARMLKIAFIYISVVFLVYLLSGLGLVWFQSFLISLGFAVILGTFVGILVIIAGLIEIKDFFWYGKGFSLTIPKRFTGRIKSSINKISTPGAIVLGFFVALVELPCTGGPYLAITAVLAKNFNFKVLVYLVIYNVIFVLPLIVITLLAFYGVKVSSIKDWKQNKRRYMRLAAGIVMLLLGTFLIYYYQYGAVH